MTAAELARLALGMAVVVVLVVLLTLRVRRANERLQRAEAELAELQRRQQALQRLLVAARIGVWQADANGVLVAADEMALRLWGRPPGASGVGRVADLRSVDHRDAVAERLRDVLRRRNALTSWPNLIVRGEGDRLWVSTTAVPLLDAQGETVGVIGVDVDIDTRQRLVLALQAAERRYRLLAEHTQSIIYTIDPQGRLTYVSPSWQTLLGHPVGEVIGRNFRPFVHPEDVPLCEDFLARTLRERRVLPPLTYRVRHRDGSVRYHRSVLAPVYDDDGRLQAVVGNAIDISTDMALRAELERVATHDALTGAANRRLFMDLLQREVERARRRGVSLGLLMLDLDHFKSLNDTHGHAAGDAVLQGFVQRCTAILRPSDRFGRLGGEEFAALLPELEADQLHAIAERLRQEVGQSPFRLPDGTNIPVTVSIGGVLSSPDEDANALLQRADRALYQAKHAGRDRVVLDPARAAPPRHIAAERVPPPFPPVDHP